VLFSPLSLQEHNGSELDRLFNIKYKGGFVNCLLSYIYSLRLRPKIWKLLTLFGVRLIAEPSNYDFNIDYLKNTKRGINFYRGGWHSEQYFQSIADDIKALYQFNLKNQCFYGWDNVIRKSENSVSVHVRRGDYLKFSDYGGIADDYYYKRAISYIRAKLENPKFYVFSNDIDWCRENFKEDDFFIVNCNKGNNSWKDMYLMSLCKHHINPNSTFSWWASWITEKCNTITIVPEKFINSTITKDIYPYRWKKI
jgi:hypothetical protein